MAGKFLDDDGLLYFWQKIKNLFAPIASPTFTGTPKAPTAAAGTDTTQIATTAFVQDVIGALDTGVTGVKGSAESSYRTGNVNITAANIGVAAGAEVNQNAFSNVKVGSTTVAADSKTDTLELVAGSNVTLTPDATNDKVTIAATDTTYSEATTSAAGLMSSSDKTKLNGIATGAEVNQNAFSNVQIGTTTVSADGKTDTLIISPGSNISMGADTSSDTIWINATDTTYDDFTGATSSAAGAHGLVPAPASGDNLTVLRGDGEWVNVLYAIGAQAEKTSPSQTGGVLVYVKTSSSAYASVADTLGVDHGGTGASTLGAGIVYHAASGTSALSIASATNIVNAIGTTAVKRATADASGNTISSTYLKVADASSTYLTQSDANTTYAKKTDISGMYKYKGSVASESALPASPSTGDVYNIEASSSYGGPGANVAWNGTAWDSLGEIFQITAITNAEIDAIVAA